MEIPFKNFVYDYYSKDILQKILSSVKIRQDKGYYLGSKAPYGYMKDENDHHRLIVDEEVRPIVKEVFTRYLSGESMLVIAKDFNKRKILTPSKHIGLQRGTGIWTGQIIRYLLTQQVYLEQSLVERPKYMKSARIIDNGWIARTGLYGKICTKPSYPKRILRKFKTD